MDVDLHQILMKWLNTNVIKNFSLFELFVRLSKLSYNDCSIYEKLNYLIEEALRNRHNLKLISGYEDSRLTLEELK